MIKKILRLRYKVLIPVMLCPILAVYALLIEPNIILIRHVKIADSKLATILNGIKVVHISDLDIESVGYRERSFIDKINGLNADLILFTGDFVGGKAADYHKAIAVIKGIKKKNVWAVMGDSDYWMEDSAKLIKELKAMGVNILINESTEISLKNGFKIAIAGVDDLASFKSDINLALRNLPAGVPAILLTHSIEAVVNNGDIITATGLKEQNVNLVLSGHTHGGQIIFPWWKILGYKKIYKGGLSNYIRGLYSFKGIPIYVSSGIGLSNVPARFMVLPEIAVLEFTE